MIKLLISLTCLTSLMYADVEPTKQESNSITCEPTKTSHTVFVEGKELRYNSIVGSLPLKDGEGVAQANMFFTAYFKQESEPHSPRPIMFCFNGGPGSASVWLHMGLLGPKKVILKDTSITPPPSGYEDNPYTFLDVVDCVIIDPISTGYSKTTPGTSAKQFHGVQEDIDTFAEFIRLFLTKFERWDSPRFLLGESYGTIRAVGLASTLHDTHFIDVNGIILISPCLDFQAYDEGNGNYLPHILTLPSFAATAWYHKKLSPEQLKRPLETFLDEVQQFALHEYATGILLGSRLTDSEKQQLIQKMSGYTGLSYEYLKASSLLVSPIRFFKELLKNEAKTVGRFDSRYLAFDHTAESEMPKDPSFDAIVGPFTSSFHQYMQKELKVTREDPYKVLNIDAVFPWNFGYNKLPAGLGYVQTTSKLATLMEKNPDLGIFIASGYYDLATPYFAAEQTIATLPVAAPLRANISIRRYEAGHMPYLHEPSHAKMKKDLSAFIKEQTPVYNAYTGA